MLVFWCSRAKRGEKNQAVGKKTCLARGRISDRIIHTTIEVALTVKLLMSELLEVQCDVSIISDGGFGVLWHLDL